jgi:hypothetical protein
VADGVGVLLLDVVLPLLLPPPPPPPPQAESAIAEAIAVAEKAIFDFIIFEFPVLFSAAPTAALYLQHICAPMKSSLRRQRVHYRLNNGFHAESLSALSKKMPAESRAKAN